VLARDGDVRYDPDFLSRAQADAAYAEFHANLRWEHPELVMFGRRVVAARMEAWYGDPGAAYRYSGLDHDPLPWTARLAQMRDRAQQATGSHYNSVLANLYPDGSVGAGWHSDDERALGSQPTIASVSLGAPRRFLFRHKADGDTIEVTLAHGSLLLMSGQTQQCWKHSVPKEKRVRDPRVNLTFRHIISR
jgi:alkylated DNA repair dioxygenase AlkB